MLFVGRWRGRFVQTLCRIVVNYKDLPVTFHIALDVHDDCGMQFMSSNAGMTSRVIELRHCLA